MGTAATFAFTSPTFAQDSSAFEDDDLTELLFVTARKRVESLQEVPLSITAISGEEFQQRGINDLRDLSKLVPSVTFDRSVAQGDFRPAIRGLQAERGRTSVGVLIDGVDITSENLQQPGGGFLANPANLDIARVEVVKGPQAALYGRSAFGGAINYILTRPSLTDFEASVSGEATEQSEFRGRAGISIPAIEDKLGLRLFGYFYDERGNFRNQKSGDFVGGSNGFGASASFLAEPSETVSFFGVVSYDDDSFDPQAAFLQTGTTVVNLTENQQAVVGSPTRTIFTGKLTPGEIFYDVDPRSRDFSDYPGADSEKLRVALTSEFDFGGMSLTSLSSYVRSEYSAYQDNDFVTVGFDETRTGAIQETERANVINQFSQELRLQSTNDSKLQWTVGGLYWNEGVDQIESNDTGLALGPLTETDYRAFFNEVNMLPFRDFNRDTEHFSFFAFAEYAITDEFSVSIEGRYVNETIDYFLNQPDFTFFYTITPGEEPGDLTLGALASVDEVDSARVKEDYFIPKLTLSYQFNEGVNLYASVGTGVKPGGFNTGGVVRFDDTAIYDREELTAYEIGAKTSWLDGRLQVNSAAFLQKYKDQQVNSQVFNEELQQLGGVIENAGRSTIWGLEFDIRAQPTEELTLSLGYTYLNAEFDEFTVLSNSASRIAELPDCNLIVFDDGTEGGRSTCELDRSGLSPADLPKHRLVARGIYRDKLTEAIDWFVDGTLTYNSEEFFDTSNVGIQDSATLIDVILGIEGDGYRAAFFVENLTDNNNITDANLYINFSTGFTPSAFGYLPQPRTFGIRASFNY